MFFVYFAVDELYFSSDFGGELTAGSQCAHHSPSSHMDQLWVIPRSSIIDDSYTLLLRLKKTEFSSKIIFIADNYNFKFIGQ